MPVKEARTPAENRHGGAPRDAASRAWDARRLASAWARGVESAFTRAFDAERAKRVSLHPSASRRFAPVVREQKGRATTRAQTRRGNGKCCSNGKGKAGNEHHRAAFAGGARAGGKNSRRHARPPAALGQVPAARLPPLPSLCTKCGRLRSALSAAALEMAAPLPDRAA